MTIQQLQYFLAVCDDLNFTRTAERLYLSRQALRMSITALERELCGTLFLNVHNHLVLTERGERFRAQAAPVVAQFEQLCTQAYQEIRSAPLRVGVSAALVPDYLPTLGDALDLFRKRYPGIPLEEHSLSNDAVLEQLLSGQLDAGLVMDLGTTEPGLLRTPLTQHTTAILAPRSSPFWARKSIRPDELSGQRLLMPGLRPAPFAPLWAALQHCSPPPSVEVAEKFYQALYLVQEQNVLSLDRIEAFPVRDSDPIRVVPLEGMPPLCASFLQAEANRTTYSDLLRGHLQQHFKGSRSA